LFTIQVLYEDILFTSSRDLRYVKLFSILLPYVHIVVVSDDLCTFVFILKQV